MTFFNNTMSCKSQILSSTKNRKSVKPGHNNITYRYYCIHWQIKMRNFKILYENRKMNWKLDNSSPRG